MANIIEEKLLNNKILTHQSIGRALEDAAEKGHIDIVLTLLTDPRLTKQSIGSALQKVAKNNHSEIMPLLIGKLISPVLAKYNQSEELSPSEKKELQGQSIY